MIYVCYKGKKILGVTDKFPYTGVKGKFTPHVPEGTTAVKSRSDWKSYEEVEQIAHEVTNVTGHTHVAVDNGPAESPRYDIIDVPKVGDEVSYAFNGDYYPDGKVVKVTKGFQIVTDTGHRYRRLRLTGAWRMEGGTWYLVKGHINERNPHL